jgi:hypothetical protein
MNKVKNFEFSKIFLEGKRPYLWILGLGFFVYVRSLSFGFTYFDDNVLILDNLFFLKDINNFFKAFTIEVFHVLHSSAAYYRPLLTISYMFDALISGNNPFFYHLTNVLIHLSTSIFVFIFLNKLKIKRELSFLWAVVFAIHPVLVQAVVWLPGRNDSLLAFFVLPSFIFLISFFEKRKSYYLWLYLLFFALALFTKESSIFIPVLVLFYGLLLSDKRNLFVNILPILFLGWIVIFSVWFYLRSIALLSSPVPYSILGSIKSIFDNLEAIILYIGKVILPFNLSVLPTLQDSTLVYGFISLVLILVLFIFSKKKNYSLITFGLLWFLIFLLPSFIRPSGYVPDFLEHRIYLPLVGIFVIFSNLSFFERIDFSKPAVSGGFILIVVVLSVLNIWHSNKFKDKISFWTSAVKTSPSHPLAHKNLGAMYYLDHEYDKAKQEFLKAVEINFEEPMIHNNLGLIYMRENNFDKAKEEFELELKINPNYDNALFNLGLLYWGQNEKQKAAEMWLKTVLINPDHKDALKGLAVYYGEIGDREKSDYYLYQAKLRGAEF